MPTLQSVILVLVTSATTALFMQGQGKEQDQGKAPSDETRLKKLLLVDENGKDAVSLAVREGRLVVTQADDDGTGPELTYDPEHGSLRMEHNERVAHIGLYAWYMLKRDSEDPDKILHRLVMRPHSIEFQGHAYSKDKQPQTYMSLSAENGAEMSLFDRMNRTTVSISGGDHWLGVWTSPHLTLRNGDQSVISMSPDKNDMFRLEVRDLQGKVLADFGPPRDDDKDE